MCVSGQHLPYLPLIALMIISIHIHPVSSFTNYVQRDKNIRQSAIDYWSGIGSYALSLNDAEVCCDDQRGCEFQTSRPARCPIRVDNELEISGCASREMLCCNPLNGPVSEFQYGVPHKTFVCCPAASYTDDTVRFCSAAREEVDIKSGGDLIIPAQNRFMIQPDKMECRAFFCGSLEDETKPVTKCENAKDQIHNLTYHIYSITQVESENEVMDCGELEEYAGNCVSEKNGGERLKGGLEWWKILLITIVSGTLLCEIIIFCYEVLKKDAVHPINEEAPLQELEDPRLVHLKEVERYLDDAIALKDMADLRLTIDFVEQKGFQDDCRQKFNEAVKTFEDLMARSAEEKIKELEEEERKTEEAKEALEQAEELLRRQQQEEQEALRSTKEARDAAKAMLDKQCTRLQIFRALNKANIELEATATEETKRAREEKEEERRTDADDVKKVAYCKQLLKQALAASDVEKLKDAIKKTNITAHETTLMDNDEELQHLCDKAKDQLERRRKKRERQEKEAEQKRKEREKLAEERRKEEEKITEEKRKEKERLADERRKEEERIAEEERKEKERLAEEQRKEEERIAEEKRIEELRLKKKLAEIKISLQAAISEKDIVKLTKSIVEVEDNNFKMDFADLHKQATALLEWLQKIEKIKKDIQELRRPLIAELKSMTSPPFDVHRSMTAAFLLLGEDLKHLKEWNNVVILLNKTGQESVKRRVQELKVQDVSKELANAAEEQIQGLTSDGVYEASQAASLFFDWTKMMCYTRKQAD